MSRDDAVRAAVDATCRWSIGATARGESFGFHEIASRAARHAYDAGLEAAAKMVDDRRDVIDEMREAGHGAPIDGGTLGCMRGFVYGLAAAIRAMKGGE